MSIGDVYVERVMIGGTGAGWTADTWGWAPTVLSMDHSWEVTSWTADSDPSKISAVMHIPDWALQDYRPRGGSDVTLWVTNPAAPVGVRTLIASGQVTDVDVSHARTPTAGITPTWIEHEIIPQAWDGADRRDYLPGSTLTLIRDGHRVEVMPPAVSPGQTPVIMTKTTIPAEPRAGYGLVLGLPSDPDLSGLNLRNAGGGYMTCAEARPGADSRIGWWAQTASGSPVSVDIRRGAVRLDTLPPEPVAIFTQMPIGTGPKIVIDAAIVPIGRAPHPYRTVRLDALDIIARAGKLRMEMPEVTHQYDGTRRAWLDGLCREYGVRVIGTSVSTLGGRPRYVITRPLDREVRGAGEMLHRLAASVGRAVVSDGPWIATSDPVTPVYRIEDTTTPLTLDSSTWTLTLAGRSLTATSMVYSPGTMINQLGVTSYNYNQSDPFAPWTVSEHSSVYEESASVKRYGPHSAKIETESIYGGDLGAIDPAAWMSDYLSTRPDPRPSTWSSVRDMSFGDTQRLMRILYRPGRGRGVALTGQLPADVPPRGRLSGVRLRMGGAPHPRLEIKISPLGEIRAYGVTMHDIRQLPADRQAKYTIGNFGDLTIRQVRDAEVT